MKPVKLYDCKVCGKPYAKQRSTQKVCGAFACTLAIAKKSAEKRASNAVAAALKAAKAERKADKAKLESLKPKAHFAKKAQDAVNAYIRFLYRDEPCISCGRFHDGQYHAGHYLSRGAHPELRFEERNIWKQCSVCNNHLSGNQVEFRKALINRIGIDNVEWLEGKHEPKRYTVEDLKAIESLYKAKLKELKTMEVCRGV